MTNFIKQVLIFALSLEAKQFEPDADGFYRIRNFVDNDSLNFTVLGDWGGFDPPFYVTPIQLHVRDMAEKVSANINSSFTLGIGDNFYMYGVESEHDKRFKLTYERVYSGPALQNPWYICLGNHDWRGSIQAQIDYSRVSERWIICGVGYVVIIFFL